MGVRARGRDRGRGRVGLRVRVRVGLRVRVRVGLRVRVRVGLRVSPNPNLAVDVARFGHILRADDADAAEHRPLAAWSGLGSG